MTAIKLAHLIDYLNDSRIEYVINIDNNQFTHYHYIGAVSSCGKHDINEKTVFGIYIYSTDIITISADTIFTLSDGQKVAFFGI